MWSPSSRGLCKAVSRSVTASRGVTTGSSVTAGSGVTSGRYAGEDKRLMYRADDRVVQMMETVKRGLGHGVSLTLQSEQPIRPDQVELAGLHLIRKADAFRTCFHYRGDELWVAEMLPPVLDFKVVEGTSLEEEMKVLMTPPDSMLDQPLFSLRMMLTPEDLPPPSNQTFPHQCHLLLSFNHAMHDGVVVYMALEWIFRILDDIVSGIPIDDKQLGKLQPGVEARKEEDKVRRELLKDPETLRKLLRERAESKTRPLITEAFGFPTEGEAVSGNVEPKMISGKVMEKLSQKCRSAGVTLNSAFLGLHNTALVEVVKEAGLDRETYHITSDIPVDTRRYMKHSCIVLGLHGLPLTHTMPTPHDVKHNFWQYVQQLDAEVRGKIKNKHVFKERVLDMMLQQDRNGTETHRDALLGNDYLFSNVYFSRTSSYGVGKSMILSNYKSFIAIEKTDYSIVTVLTTSGDQGMFRMTYSTRYMMENNAVKLSDSMVRMLQDVSE